jgi:hypothetical protein
MADISQAKPYAASSPAKSDVVTIAFRSKATGRSSPIIDIMYEHYTHEARWVVSLRHSISANEVNN